MQSKTNDNMVFDESNSNYTLFSDQLFNGKEYELDFFLPNSMPYKLIQADTLKGGFYWIYVELQSLSKDVYLYIKSIDGADNITNGLFNEPYQVYSNIKNGIGIWGTYSSSIDTLKVGVYPIEGVEYTYNKASIWYHAVIEVMYLFAVSSSKTCLSGFVAAVDLTKRNPQISNSESCDICVKQNAD